LQITEEEIEQFKRKVLRPINVSDEQFREFHNVKSLKDYVMSKKQGLIEMYLLDQVSLRNPDIARLVYEVLEKIPLYDLEEIIDPFTELKEVGSSECYAFMTTNPFAEKLASERKYKEAYEWTKTTRWTILLYQPDFKNHSKECALFTIAHELAHRHLKHIPTILSALKEGDTELDADALAEKWGFKKPKNWPRK